MRKKIVGIFVIILFLGVAFAPSIYASREIVETSGLNSDLVEITIEVGNREHTVMLTSDQALELENLIDQTQTRLDIATTMEETAQIFDETVVSLFELGLLPKDMSIREVQSLVKGDSHFSKLTKILISKDSNNHESLDDKENRFCLIAGHTVFTGFYPLVLLPLLLLPYGSVVKFLIRNLEVLFGVIILLKYFCPIDFSDFIGLGWTFLEPKPIPAIGWIHTIGLNGIKSWNGRFYGDIQFPNYSWGHSWGNVTEMFIGVLGFTGIKILEECALPFPSEYFYLGAARRIKIRYEKPGV